MKRTVVCSLALALALPAGANAAADLDSSTAPQARRGTAPDLSISFTVRTRNGNPKQVKKFVANGVPFTCSDGSSGTTTEPARLGKKMKVNDKRKFHGRAKLGETTMIVRGKIRKKGRARGTVRLFGPEATDPSVTCDSGAVGWRVRRN
jgi:hypothetical protein